MTNSFNQNTKQLIIYPEGEPGQSLELAATSWERRMSNDISDFSIPSLEDDVERKAQNLNQIQENHIFNALLSTEFLRLSDVVTETETKEEADILLQNYFTSNTRVTVEYGHLELTGYLTELNVEEEAQNSNSVFRVDFNLMIAEPMSGGD